MRWCLAAAVAFAVFEAACASGKSAEKQRGAPGLFADDAGVVHTWRRATVPEEHRVPVPVGPTCEPYSGTVRCLAQTDGGLRDCHLTRGTGGFDAGAMIVAIAGWQVTPAEQDGLPREMPIKLSLSWTPCDGGLTDAGERILQTNIMTSAVVSPSADGGIEE
ncbi:MAG: hypothetical protein ACJ790_10585 [Myxococcaceae bacterium]